MFLRLRHAMAALVGTALMNGCAPSLFPVEMPVTASISDSGGTASLIPYQPLVVRLPANPSTGYSWRYVVAGDDVLGLETINGEAPAPSGMVGVAGEEVWSFRAQGTGRAVLTYVYERSWEQNTPPAKIFTLFVTVSPGQ